jgi:general secretion pathway protein D
MSSNFLKQCALVFALIGLGSVAFAQGTPPQTFPARAAPAVPAIVAPQDSTSANVNLNFPNVDVHEAAKAILGDILNLNYAVDPSVTGTVTVVTAHPVSKADVFPILEDSLKAANLGLVRRGAVYTIVPMAEARRQPQLVTQSDAGYGTEEIQLHYVNATQLKKLLDPLVPDNSIAQADTGRNILMVTGSAGERRSIRDLVHQFDLDWLRGMSFQMFIPKHTDAKTLLPELDQILNGEDAPTAGLVRLIAIDRLNGILAISAQPAYLREVRHWIDTLDSEGADAARRLFVYRVQNGRASDLATVLVNAFGGAPNKNNQTQPTAKHTSRQAPIATFQSQDTAPQSPTQSSSIGGGLDQGNLVSGNGFSVTSVIAASIIT